MSNSSNHSKKTIQTLNTDNEISTKFIPSENDEAFFRELIENFHNRIVNTDSFDNFENLLIEWIKDTLEHNDVHAETFLESIQNQQILLSSLIGFFYQHGIGCNVNKDKALEMYLMAIKQDKVQTINNTIAKYLLSLFYYKDIILVNKSSINNPLKNEIMISQFVNPNEPDRNMIDDDGSENHKKEIGKSNNDLLEYQDETEINPNEKAEFEQYVISARRGNIKAQYNLGRCYKYGIGTYKDEKKAFEWYLESAKNGNLKGQNKLGYFYEHEIGTNKDEKKAFEWYLEFAKNGNSKGQNNLGRCYEDQIGTNKDEKKAFELYLKSAEAGI